MQSFEGLLLFEELGRLFFQGRPICLLYHLSDSRQHIDFARLSSGQPTLRLLPYRKRILARQVDHVTAGNRIGIRKLPQEHGR